MVVFTSTQGLYVEKVGGSNSQVGDESTFPSLLEMRALLQGQVLDTKDR